MLYGIFMPRLKKGAVGTFSYSMLLLLLLLLFFVLLAARASSRPRNSKDIPESAISRAYVLGVADDGDSDECWKDVDELCDLLRKSETFRPEEVFKYVNSRAEGKHFTSKLGIQKTLAKLRVRPEPVSFVLVHFCGCGDAAGVETSDGEMIAHEWFEQWAMSFGPDTRVLATFDWGDTPHYPPARGASGAYPDHPGARGASGAYPDHPGARGASGAYPDHPGARVRGRGASIYPATFTAGENVKMLYGEGLTEHLIRELRRSGSLDSLMA